MFRLSRIMPLAPEPPAREEAEEGGASPFSFVLPNLLLDSPSCRQEG